MMRRQGQRREVMVATLGTEPQVVTIALDLLQEKGHRPEEVVVVHTAGEVVRPALARLTEEFASGAVAYRPLPIVGPSGPVADIVTDEDATALLQTLYREVRALKRARCRVHLSIAGGRKPMAVYGMVVAQLLFDEDDRVWHLLSEGWEPGSERVMHLRPGDRAWLVPVPVLRWTESAAAIAALMAQDDPWAAIRRQRELTQAQAMQRRGEFLRHWLSPAEREVVELLVREGLDNAGIARRLYKSERTVANQLTQVYAKLHEFLGFPEATTGRSVLIAELAPYFALKGGG
jgi:CRISPR-associated protein Csx14